MSAPHPSAAKAAARIGLRTRAFVWLRDKTHPIRQAAVDFLLHDTKARSFAIGANTVSWNPSGAGDVGRWSAGQVALAQLDLGMDASGRPSWHDGSAARTSCGTHEVVLTDGTNPMGAALAMGSNKITGLAAGSASGDAVRYDEALLADGTNALSADLSANSNKITNLTDGAAATQDACSVAQMETYVSNRIVVGVHAGFAGHGLIGTGTITEINGLTPATGDVVVAEDAGTPSAGSSDALVAGSVAEYDGANWKEIVTGSGGFVPVGTRLLVSTTSDFIAGGGLTDATDEGKIADYDGTSLTPSAMTSKTDGVMVAIRGENAKYEGAVLTFDGSVPNGVWRSSGGIGADHGNQTGLGDDDHTQYTLNAGRSGGQEILGGTASGDHLDLVSTGNATKGDVRIAAGTDLVLRGDDTIVPETTGEGSVGTSSLKFKEVNAVTVTSGDHKFVDPMDPTNFFNMFECTDTGVLMMTGSKLGKTWVVGHSGRAATASEMDRATNGL